jgi:protein TonB
MVPHLKQPWMGRYKGRVRPGFAPVTASVAIHAGFVGVALLLAGATAPSPQVIFLELTEIEQPAAPAPPPSAGPQLAPQAPHPRPAPRPAPPPPAPKALAAAPPVATVPSASRVESAEAAPVSPPNQMDTTQLAAPPLPRGEQAASGASTAAPTPSSAAGVTQAPDGVVSRAPAAPAPVVAAVPRENSARRVIPRAVEQQRPAYPASARRARIQGTTLLAVLIADDGRVAEIVVKESAGHPDLDVAAADAVRRWRFTPARRGDDPIAMWVELPVEFRLR